MLYQIFATEAEADQKARDDWEAVLDRPKRPEDVTEFLWGRMVGLDGRTATVIPDEFIPQTLGIAEEHIPRVPDQRGTVDNPIIDTLPEDNWPPPPPIIGQPS